MDYSRSTGEFRMLERFLPQVRPSMHPTFKKTKAPGPNKNSVSASSTGAWPTPLGVHRVSWNNGNGLAAAGLLASGTAIGLGRVDWLEGRWIRDKAPYGGVVNIRRDVGGGEDDDEDEDEEEEEGKQVDEDE